MDQIMARRTSITSRGSFTSRTSSSRYSHAQLSSLVKQNQLQWMFNRRKNKLAQTSQENVQIYLRIRNQKSGLAKTLNKKVMVYPPKSKPRIGLSDKQNIQVQNEIKRRDHQIKDLLNNIAPLTDCKRISARKLV